VPSDDARERIALGVQQPWAELILRGVKTVEIRSQDTRIRGRIFLYASKRVSALSAAADAAARHGIDDVEDLPRGVLVGTVEIVDSQPAQAADADAACVPADVLAGRFGWRLAAPVRLPQPLTPTFLPYGVWFYPFRRRGDEAGERETL
jgi:hypothetical protein